MTRRIAVLCPFSLIVALPCATSSFAQVQTGTPNFGTFSSQGPDVINLGNLNVYLGIPILNKPQRGANLTYNLGFNSSVWSPSTSGTTTSWTPASQWGWTGFLPAGPTEVSYSTSVQTGSCYYNGVVSYTQWNYNNATYVDALGVKHNFNPGDVAYIQSPGGNGCPPNGQQGPTTPEPATDGSGYSITLIAGPGTVTATLTDKNGNKINAPVVSNPPASVGSETVSDTNGNQITVSNGVYTDTTGNTALTVTSGPSGVTLTYPIYTTASTKTASYVVNYSTYTVKTNFGCSGVSEYGPTATSLVSSITLPDGSGYHFSYETTPGTSGDVTGRVASITLPAGGTVAYTYLGGSNGIVCADGSTAGLRRIMAGTVTGAASVSTYTRTPGTSSSTTTVTDGLQNTLVYSFVNAGRGDYLETQRTVYQGAQSGTAILSRNTCYNAAASPCTTTAINLPILQLDTYETLNGLEQHGSTAKFNASGLQTEEDDYDFGGATSRGALLRKEVWTYPTTGIPNLISSDEVYDGSGNEAGLTTYQYDQTSVTGTTGLPQHSGPIGSQRGNLTTMTQYTSATSTIATTMSYEDTGNVLSLKTPNGTAQYNYEPTTHVYLYTATPPTPSSGVSLPNNATNDVTSGVVLTTIDPNSQSVTYSSYDSFLRPLSVSNPDGGTVGYTYSANTVNQTTDVGTSRWALYDGFVRPSRSTVSNGQGSFYQQDTCYDASGNVAFVSLKFQGAGLSAPTVCSGSGDQYSHDVLGRVTKITHADSSSASYSYSGRAVQYTDENGMSRISQLDGIGRLTYVCEISATTTMPGSGSPTACNLDIAATGFITGYAYNLASNQTTVTQGAQTRVFQRDWLNRPTSVQEPESGTTTYTYAYNSTGLQVTRTRPTANQTSSSTLTTTTTQYDSLGRPLTVIYSDGTPTKSFAYDTNVWVWGNFTPTNLKGRLYNASGGNAATVYSYDAMGRVTAQAECLPSGCGNAAYDKRLQYSYNHAGMLTSESDGAGDTLSYGRSLAGEITGITNSFSDSTDPANIIVPNSVANTVFGPTSYTLGNGLSTVLSYDTLGRNNGGWVCQGSTQAYCTNGTAQIYGNTLQFSGTLVYQVCDTVINSCNNYAYDEFNRIKKRTSGAAYTYTYDRYGNRWNQTLTSGSGPAPQYNINTSNNQVAGFSYDAVGEVTNDGFHSYTYDADGNVTAVDGGSTATYGYDALNHRVDLVNGSRNFQFVFDVMGRRTSTWAGGSLSFVESLAYADTQPVAFRTGNATHFKHHDYLGTTRSVTSYNGTVEGTFYSLPFGDGYSWTGGDSDWEHYAGTDHDPESSTEHAQFRQYSSTAGRWMSADPYYGSYDSRNPQSFNRYSYVLNNPLGFRDTKGLFCEYEDDADDGILEEVDYNSSPDECGSTGGDWFPDGWTSVDGNIETNNDPSGVTGLTYNYDLPGNEQTGCVQPNSPQQAVVSALTPVAQLLNQTVGYGVGGSAGVGKFGFGISFSLSQQLLVSPDGTAGLAFTYTPSIIGLSSAGAGGLFGVQLTSNLNSTFEDNAGLGIDAGAIIADEVGVGYDVSNSGQTLTVGVGFGGYGHGGTLTFTIATQFCSIP